MGHYPHEIRKTADLIPYAQNSRTHSEQQINHIANSINGDWKFFPLNDCYAVDANGNVYSVCTRQKSKSGNLIEKYRTKILKGSTDKDGYRTYRITINGQKKHIKGHRIVALSFFGKSEKPQVNHIDGDKQNNKLANLEFVTPQENQTHAINLGLWNKNMAKHKRKILNADYVSIYALNKVVGLSRAEIAKMNRVSRQTIDMVIGRMESLVGEYFNA